jgi:redox-sensitive bicupin YhaK (pirin superfamily)
MKKLAFIKRSNSQHWVGDGFPVQSIFSYNDIGDEISPFLLLDYAGPTHFSPTDSRRGVGQHPHRGFETVTIVYEGEVSHSDSTGGGGTIGQGDVQWMTAASGLLHEEYHSAAYAKRGGPFEMIQLWVNLPAKDKMSAPSYQSITYAQIPRVTLPEDAGVARIIAGHYGTATGPARTFSAMNVWDLRLHAGRSLSITLPEGHNSALFVLRGAVRIDDVHTIRNAELAVMERDGTQLIFDTTEETVLLVLSGEPLNEPVVGAGPFVMNTRAEIIQAINDFESGKFRQSAS